MAERTTWMSSDETLIWRGLHDYETVRTSRNEIFNLMLPPGLPYLLLIRFRVAVIDNLGKNIAHSNDTMLPFMKEWCVCICLERNPNVLGDAPAQLIFAWEFFLVVSILYMVPALPLS